MSDSKKFIIESFVGRVPAHSKVASAMIAAVAATLAAAGEAAESFDARRGRLLADLEKAARHPSRPLVDAVAARLGTNKARARAIVRAAAQAFLDQGERGLGFGLNMASSVPAEVLRAAEWDRPAAQAAEAAAESERPAPAEEYPERNIQGSGERDEGGWGGQREMGSDDFGQQDIPGGPHGGGGGPG